MRRVLAVCHQFPPLHQTGTEILCLSTMQALQRRGHTVLAVTADPDRLNGLPPATDTVDGIAVIRVPTRRLLARDTLGRVQAELAGSAAQRALLSIVAEQRPDIVHLHHSFCFGLPALAAIARTRPVVATVTDYAPVCPYATLALPDGPICAGPAPDRNNCVAHLTTGTFAGGLLRLLNGTHRADTVHGLVARYLGSAVDLFNYARSIAVASHTMRDVFAAAGLPTERILVLPHQAPPAIVPDSRIGSPLRIGFLGTLKPWKGPHVFLEAVRLLPSDLPCVITVRGDLSADPNYVARLRRLSGTDPRVAILGRVPYARFGEAIAALDVIVVPSLWLENLPLVLLTALEHRRYVVVSDAPGLVPALRAGDGVVVQAGDPAALAKVLEALVRDPTPVRKARERAAPLQNFEIYVNAVETMYDRAEAKDGMLVA